MAFDFLIALGSNLGSHAGGRAATLVAALRHLTRADSGLRLGRVSRFFHTPCFPEGTGPDYVNAAALITSGKTPEDFLHKLHETEAFLGRERVQRWGSRSLDLDLLAAGAAVVPDAATHARWRDLPLAEQMQQTPDRLILPHPRLQERAFVLVPLLDIAPDWVHPILRRKVADLAAALPSAARDSVKPLPVSMPVSRPAPLPID